jgi:hypothetical protein
MHSLQQVSSGQAPARAASTVDAENARLDAQLELAAKKAALAGMQRAAAGQGADAAPAVAGAGSAPPSGPRSGSHVIVYSPDGKTIEMDNPSAEQLRQAGMSVPSGPDFNGWQRAATTAAVMWAIVAIVWITLAHRRRMHTVSGTAASPDMNARMVRIENAIESVAVEVERISEGQRYTSRMLSEGAARPVNNVPDSLVAVLNNRGDA